MTSNLFSIYDQPTGGTDTDGRNAAQARAPRRPSTSRDDALGELIKAYGAREAGRRATPGVPLAVRVDGRSLSKFTRGMARLFDVDYADLMVDGVKCLVEQTRGKIAYVRGEFRPVGVSRLPNSAFLKASSEMGRFRRPATAAMEG